MVMSSIEQIFILFSLYLSMQRTETIRSISTHFEYHIISSNCDLKTTFNFFFQICLLDYYSEANTNKIESAIHTVAVRLKIGQQNITTEPNRAIY